MKKGLGIIVLISFVYPAALFAGAADDPCMTVLSADGQGIVLELKVPELKVEQLREGGVLYHLVTIPGFGLTQEIGRPQVPVRGALIGLPPTGGVTLEILDASFRVLSGYQLYPAPKSVVDPNSRMIRQEFAIDPVAYSTDVFSPESIVKQGFLGYMRDQRVVQILFYPIQFNPLLDKIKVYQTIRVRARFEGTFATGMTKPYTGIARSQVPMLGPYERLLKDALLNYSSLPRGE